MECPIKCWEKIVCLSALDCGHNQIGNAMKGTFSELRPWHRSTVAIVAEGHSIPKAAQGRINTGNEKETFGVFARLPNDDIKREDTKPGRMAAATELDPQLIGSKKRKFHATRCTTNRIVQIQFSPFKRSPGQWSNSPPKFPLVMRSSVCGPYHLHVSRQRKKRKKIPVSWISATQFFSPLKDRLPVSSSFHISVRNCQHLPIGTKTRAPCTQPGPCPVAGESMKWTSRNLTWEGMPCLTQVLFLIALYLSFLLHSTTITKS